MITDLAPDLAPLPVLDLVNPVIGSACAGYGGLDEAVLAVIGGQLAWYAEHDPEDKRPTAKQAAPRILGQHYPGVPNHGDVTAIDWTQVEPVDVFAAGFPCKDISAAGRRAGLAAGTRSGSVWSALGAPGGAIDVLRPRLVFLENVAHLLSTPAQRSASDGTDSDLELGAAGLGDAGPRPVLRALGAVLGDLADLGYDARWITVPASIVGACHLRKRVFILAYPASDPPRLRLGDGRSAGVGGLETAAVAGAAPGDDDLSLLPTPTAADGDRASHVYPRGNKTLIGALLPTPTATPYGNNQSPSPGAAVRPSLDGVVRDLLPTPTARLGDDTSRGADPERYQGPKSMNGRRSNLDDCVAAVEAGSPWLLPTPTTRDHKGANQRQDETCLHGALLPTPTTSDVRGAGQHGDGGRDLRTEITLLPTQRATDGTKGGPNQRGSSGDLMLPSAVQQLLPTPRVTAVRTSWQAAAKSSSSPSLEQAVEIAQGHRPRELDALVDAPESWAPGDGGGRWGKFEEAIRRHEVALGRSAPDATEPGAVNQARIRACADELGVDGYAARAAIERGIWGARLSARFVEWMMMLPDGWVCDVPGLTRNEKLARLGNGVIPRQAATAYLHLLMAGWGPA